MLGIVSPTAFLNGRRVLKIELARTALENHLAAPLKIRVEEAALKIYAAAVEMMANLSRDTCAAADWRATAPPTLFAYGGNGPLFATAIAEALGTVLSAYGSAIADVMQVYERALVSADPARELADVGLALRAQAARDLRGEGFDPAVALYRWEIEGAAGAQVALDGALDLTRAASCPEPQLLRGADRNRIPAAGPPAHQHHRN